LAAPGAAADKVSSSVKAKLMAQIDAWRGKPVKLPLVDKSRIRGQGWLT
jgi:hypothetical protein